MQFDNECGEVIKNLQIQVGTFQTQMQMNHTQMTQASEILKEVLHCLKGNTIDADGGLVAKLSHMETDYKLMNKRLETLERWKERLVWIVITLSASSSLIIEAIRTLIKTQK